MAARRQISMENIEGKTLQGSGLFQKGEEGPFEEYLLSSFGWAHLVLEFYWPILEIYDFLLRF